MDSRLRRRCRVASPRARDRQFTFHSLAFLARVEAARGLETDAARMLRMRSSRPSATEWSHEDVRTLGAWTARARLGRISEAIGHLERGRRTRRGARDASAPGGAVGAGSRRGVRAQRPQPTRNACSHVCRPRLRHQLSSALGRGEPMSRLARGREGFAPSSSTRSRSTANADAVRARAHGTVLRRNAAACRRRSDARRTSVPRSTRSTASTRTMVIARAGRAGCDRRGRSPREGDGCACSRRRSSSWR